MNDALVSYLLALSALLLGRIFDVYYFRKAHSDRVRGGLLLTLQKARSPRKVRISVKRAYPIAVIILCCAELLHSYFSPHLANFFWLMLGSIFGCVHYMIVGKKELFDEKELIARGTIVNGKILSIISRWKVPDYALVEYMADGSAVKARLRLGYCANGYLKEGDSVIVFYSSSNPSQALVYDRSNFCVVQPRAA